MTRLKLQLALKRAYETPTPEDGQRILIDRLWPRGLSRERAQVDLWLKEIAPSTELRRWFGHEPEKFDEFHRRYEAELSTETGQAALEQVRTLAQRGPVKLVFGAHDPACSNAAVLRDLLLQER